MNGVHRILRTIGGTCVNRLDRGSCRLEFWLPRSIREAWFPSSIHDFNC